MIIKPNNDNKETIDLMKLNKSRQTCITDVHRKIQSNRKISHSIRQCCHHIHYNDCIEKQCIIEESSLMIENCLQIFLLITDPICLPVIRQPIQHCDVNVG